MASDELSYESLESSQSSSEVPERDEYNLIDGRYQLIEVLGQGGMGTVIKARHANLDKVVAIKVLNASQLFDDENSKARFEVEAKAGSKLSHPNLVAVFDYGFTKAGEPYLVMEYIEGESLEQWLNREGKLTPSEFLHIFIQACKALQFIHNKGIIHRDLKPSNIMIQIIGDERYAKLLDFGIAKVLSDDGKTAQHLTATGAVFGSPLYMSPEQCQGEKIDHRSDIYSLGCVMYMCLVGQPPLQGENPLQTIFKHVNLKPAPIQCSYAIEREIASVVEKCLEKNPAERFKSAGEVLTALNMIAVESAQRRTPALNDPESANSDAKKPIVDQNQQLLHLQDQRLKNALAENEIRENSTSANQPASLRRAAGQQLASSTPTHAPWAKIAALASCFVVVVGCCALLPAVLPAQYSTIASSYFISQGDSSFSNNNWSDAEAKYKEALKSVGKSDLDASGKIHSRLGLIYFQLGRNDDALASFNEAEKELDRHKTADAQRDYYLDSVFGKAKVLAQESDYRHADAAFSKTVDFAADNNISDVKKGDISLAQAENAAKYNYEHAMIVYDQAQAAYRRSDEKPADKIAQVLVGKAEVQQKMNNVQAAAKLANEARNESENVRNIDSTLQNRITSVLETTGASASPMMSTTAPSPLSTVLPGAPPTPSFAPASVNPFAAASSAIAPPVVPGLPIPMPVPVPGTLQYEEYMTYKKGTEAARMRTVQILNNNYNTINAKLEQLNRRQ